MPVRTCPCSHINQKRSLRSLASLGKRKEQPNTGSGQGTSARFGISWFGCRWGDVWAWLCMIALKSRIINLPSDSVHVGETSGSAGFLCRPTSREETVMVIENLSSLFLLQLLWFLFRNYKRAKRAGRVFWWCFGFTSKFTFREKAKQVRGQQWVNLRNTQNVMRSLEDYKKQRSASNLLLMVFWDSL